MSGEHPHPDSVGGMADEKDLLEFCTTGTSPDSSGPPIKRLRGGNGGEGSSMGTPPFEDATGLQAADEGQPGPQEDWGLCPATHLAYLRDYHTGSDEGGSSHPFSSGLGSGAFEADLARRRNAMRQESRSIRPQVGHMDLCREPSTFFDVGGEPLDIADDALNPPDNLQWARKSHRQTRTSSRLQPEGPDFMRERVPESPFGWCSPPPPTLPSSPQSEVFQFARGLASPPRMRAVTRSGAGGGPVPSGQSRRFSPWDDIWDPEDDLLDLGMLQASRSGLHRPGRGPTGRPSSAENSRSQTAPRSESFPCGFFEPTRSGDHGENSSFPSVAQRPPRGMDSRRAALLETRDAIQRHRAQRARMRERRSLREEFGALMNALGILHTPEGAPNRPREPRNHVAAVQEAVIGIARSGLPPHLLFTDRDFTSDDYEWLCQLDEGIENRKGADDDTINKLPTLTYADVEFEDEEEEVELEEDEEGVMIDPGRRCPICLDRFGSGDMLRLMPCKHKYHKDCIDRWLKIKATCPICNLNIKGD